MRYRSLTVFSLGPWAALIQPEFHVLRSTWDTSQRDRIFVYRAFTFCGQLFQHCSANSIFCNSVRAQQRSLGVPTTPGHSNDCCLTLCGFRLAPFRSPLLGGSLRFLFLRLLRCFTSPGSSPIRSHRTAPVGLPHSDIRGSRPACGSPRRFAACCVFRRL